MWPILATGPIRCELAITQLSDGLRSARTGVTRDNLEAIRSEEKAGLRFWLGANVIFSEASEFLEALGVKYKTDVDAMSKKLERMIAEGEEAGFSPEEMPGLTQALMNIAKGAYRQGKLDPAQ